jgi:hypothetical protein
MTLSEGEQPQAKWCVEQCQKATELRPDVVVLDIRPVTSMAFLKVA